MSEGLQLPYVPERSAPQENGALSARKGEELSPEAKELLLRDLADNGVNSVQAELFLNTQGFKNWQEAVDTYDISPSEVNAYLKDNDVDQELEVQVNQLPRANREAWNTAKKHAVPLAAAVTAAIVAPPLTIPLVIAGLAPIIAKGVVYAGNRNDGRFPKTYLLGEPVSRAFQRVRNFTQKRGWIEDPEDDQPILSEEAMFEFVDTVLIAQKRAKEYQRQLDENLVPIEQLKSSLLAELAKEIADTESAAEYHLREKSQQMLRDQIEVYGGEIAHYFDQVVEEGLENVKAFREKDREVKNQESLAAGIAAVGSGVVLGVAGGGAYTGITAAVANAATVIKSENVRNWVQHLKEQTIGRSLLNIPQARQRVGVSRKDLFKNYSTNPESYLNVPVPDFPEGAGGDNQDDTADRFREKMEQALASRLTRGSVWQIRRERPTGPAGMLEVQILQVRRPSEEGGDVIFHPDINFNPQRAGERPVASRLIRGRRRLQAEADEESEIAQEKSLEISLDELVQLHQAGQLLYLGNDRKAVENQEEQNWRMSQVAAEHFNTTRLTVEDQDSIEDVEAKQEKRSLARDIYEKLGADWGNPEHRQAYVIQGTLEDPQEIQRQIQVIVEEERRQDPEVSLNSVMEAVRVVIVVDNSVLANQRHRDKLIEKYRHDLAQLEPPVELYPKNFVILPRDRELMAYADDIIRNEHRVKPVLTRYFGMGREQAENTVLGLLEPIPAKKGDGKKKEGNSSVRGGTKGN